MSSSSPSSSGITFGNYEVVAKEDGTPVLLGGGSYGKTYRGVHSFLGSTVALKVIHDSFAFDSGIKKRFLAEARAMARLRHPHVAQILNCGEEDGTLYYAVEYCDGGDLEHVARKMGALPPGTVLALARQAAEALAYVHENGFLHRDLKPSNLMLATPAEGGNAVLKVIDFGLVKQFDQTLSSGITQTGQFLGTMLFASPEQLREEHLDARSDIFSLGLTLWFMLKGGSPFVGKPAQVVAQRLSGKSYAGDLPSDLPPALRTLLVRMLAMEVTARPAHMREVLKAIDDCAAQMSAPESDLSRLSGVEDSLDDIDVESAMGTSSVHLTSVERLTGDCYALDSEQMEVDFGVRHRGRRLPSGKVVALTMVRRSLAASPTFVQHLEKTVQRASQCGGPQLIRPFELVKFRDHLVLVEEWVQGLDLLTLLRQRKTISLAEALPILRQLADACDLARRAQLSKLEIAAHRVILQFEKLPWSELDSAAQTQMLSQPLSQWPPFTVRIAPTYTIEEKASGPPTMSQMPHLTVVGGGEQDADLTSRYGRLIYRIVSGHPALATATVSRSAYISVAGLTEESNHFLSQIIAGESRQEDCLSILEDLWRHERLSPSVFKASAHQTSRTGTPTASSSKTGRSSGSATKTPIGRPASARPGKAIATVPVSPMAPAAAAQMPAWDLKDARPVPLEKPVQSDPDKPRIIPLGKKPPPPLSTPVPQATPVVARPAVAARPQAQPAKRESEFWTPPPPAPPPVAQPRKASMLPIVAGGVGCLGVIALLLWMNRPAPDHRQTTRSDDVSKPVLRPKEPVTIDAEPPKPALPEPKPLTVVQGVTGSSTTPSPAEPPKIEPPKPVQPRQEPAVTEPPARMVVAPTPPPPAPPPPVDPIAEQEKRYAATSSAADAQKLVSLLEPKLRTEPLAQRPMLAKRIASLWRVTKADDKLLPWQLYSLYRSNDLNTEAAQALSEARRAEVKEAWVEHLNSVPPRSPEYGQGQQHLAEKWPADPEGKSAIRWLQTNIEARIPVTAALGKVEDPWERGRLISIPRDQWKPGGEISLPEEKRYFRLPAHLPTPRVELVRSGDGRVIPGVAKSPSTGQQTEIPWESWRRGARVQIGAETFEMPDDLPAPDMVATAPDGEAGTVRSPYGGHVVKVRESDWHSGASISDTEYAHLRFRLPDSLPERFMVKDGIPIEGRYTAVKSPYPQGNEIPVSASAWADGEVTDPVTRKKVKLQRPADPRLTAKVVDAYAKAVINPYTQTTETWKNGWEAGASAKWGGSGFSYVLPSPLPSAEVKTADFLSFTSVSNPYGGDSVTVTESDWNAGTITPKKGRPIKLPVVKDPKSEAAVVDIDSHTVRNPYTGTDFVWPGVFAPKQTASWGPFTMQLPSNKNAFKEQVTIPRAMQSNFKTSTGLYISWRSSEGCFRSDRIRPGGDLDELCRVVTEYAQQNGRLPLDHVFVFDGTDRLVSRRLKAGNAGSSPKK